MFVSPVINGEPRLDTETTLKVKMLDFNSGASKSGGEVPDERASDVGGQGVDYGRA